jgi:hypothetical protein
MSGRARRVLLVAEERLRGDGCDGRPFRVQSGSARRHIIRARIWCRRSWRRRRALPGRPAELLRDQPGDCVPLQPRAHLALALAIFWVATLLVAAGIFLASRTQPPPRICRAHRRGDRCADGRFSRRIGGRARHGQRHLWSLVVATGSSRWQMTLGRRNAHVIARGRRPGRRRRPLRLLPRGRVGRAG